MGCLSQNRRHEIQHVGGGYWVNASWNVSKKHLPSFCFERIIRGCIFDRFQKGRWMICQFYFRSKVGRRREVIVLRDVIWQCDIKIEQARVSCPIVFGIVIGGVQGRAQRGKSREIVVWKHVWEARRGNADIPPPLCIDGDPRNSLSDGLWIGIWSFNFFRLVGISFIRSQPTQTLNCQEQATRVIANMQHEHNVAGFQFQWMYLINLI